MNQPLLIQLSQQARFSASQFDWQSVGLLSERMLQIDPRSAEGLYLKARALKNHRDFVRARAHFEKCLECDDTRYDAAIELAALYSSMRRNGEAYELLSKYENLLSNSPHYLDSAGTTYIHIGMPEKAWPLYKKANELQPEIDVFQANMASCAIYMGELSFARNVYRKLIDNNPSHRQNHRHFSRTAKAKDESHINEMKALLQDTTVDSARNTPLYFAIGKELEDLGKWEECFQFYAKGCSAISDKIKYTPDEDIALIDKIIETCDAEWLQGSPVNLERGNHKTPIFIAGLPRTGTTLVERIVSSHSQVSSLGETMFLQMSLKESAGVPKQVPLTANNIENVAMGDLSNVTKIYMDALAYRIGTEPSFIEKLPLNFLYLGLIAKAWPDAKLVVLNRNPMDACFSMFKQVFTFVYKFSYSLEHLGQYYVAYDRLLKHWRGLLGERLIEVKYEALVENQVDVTKDLLEALDLNFEQGCIDFQNNTSPSTTASSVQVRSKVNSSAVGKWKHFEAQLKGLKAHLEANGISTD